MLPARPTTPEIAMIEAGAKERILEAAIRLFCTKGYEATSVREIVEAAGVTKPVLYYYYKNKEDLFHAIVEVSLTEYRDRLKAICEDTALSIRDRIGAVAQLHFDAARANPEMVRFINSIAFSGMYDSVVDFRNYWRGNMEFIIDLFFQAQECGAIRMDLSARSMAFHFMSIVLGAMRGMVYFPELMETSPFEKDLMDIVLHGIGMPPGNGNAGGCIGKRTEQQ